MMGIDVLYDLFITSLNSTVVDSQSLHKSYLHN
jgi:hypothetical protein